MKTEASRTLRIDCPSPQEIRLLCTLFAPRRLVFDAFTRPALLRRWLGREGDEMRACDVDLRVGGSYRYVWFLRQGKRTLFRETGEFREIDPPARLVAVESFDDFGETVITTTLTEALGRTSVTTITSYASREVRDSVLASGLEAGASESYERLEELLRYLR